MTATTLSPSARFGASLAAGAIAFAAFAGTGFAKTYAGSVNGFNTDQLQGMTVGSFCDNLSDYRDFFSRDDYRQLKRSCNQVDDFADNTCSCGQSLGSMNMWDMWQNPSSANNCGTNGTGVQGFNFGDFVSPFQNAFGGLKSANVNSNASTSVNNTINAGSANDVNVHQNGSGLQNADVNADANTTVNNEINAFSQNDVNVQQ
jgi:hypothetical protein